MVLSQPDGYQMWRCRHNAYRADGANGQYILVLPDKDAVNKAVARFNQTQCQLLENIKGLIGKLNTTVEKSGKV